MEIMKTEDVFNRSGLASLSDLNSSVCKNIFSKLEKEQDNFLKKESEFRSEGYKWPRDPLHNWSRAWEYPYVYYHLVKHLNALSQKLLPKVADVGSGVTFFPFSLAKLGYQVVCTDIDRICEKDLLFSRAFVPHSPGTIDFRLIEDSDIPFENSECDALYCISVLEHIPDFEKTISEMARILKPGGLCLITCDINLSPENGLQLDCHQYGRLISSIEKNFVRICPDLTIHPVDLLTSKNSIYPLECEPLGIIRYGYRIAKQKVLKPLFGRKSGKVRFDDNLFAVLGLVLRKKM